jgi:hypothetical protein
LRLYRNAEKEQQMSNIYSGGRTGLVNRSTASSGSIRAKVAVAGYPSDLDPGFSELNAKYNSVRSMTDSIVAGLTAEDQMVQSCPDASPLKWHQAHAT